jgi:hypothetical protein
MLAGTSVRLALTFLLTLVLVLGCLTRSMVADDLAIVASHTSASDAPPGETLEDDTNDGNIIVSPSLLHSCPFYHFCLALGSNSPFAVERTFSKDGAKFYVFDRALLI